jgi:hypothetical protein
VLRDHSIDTEAARLGRYFMNTAGAEFSFAEP